MPSELKKGCCSYYTLDDKKYRTYLSPCVWLVACCDVGAIHEVGPHWYDYIHETFFVLRRFGNRRGGGLYGEGVHYIMLWFDVSDARGLGS